MIDPGTDAAISGRARLDNRGDLVRDLGLDGGQAARLTDLDLVQSAYLRWRERCAERLLGDFAFVVRERRRGAAFGARDHFGVMPFYYRASAAGLAFALRASDIPADDGLPLEIDERRLADACIPELECLDRTSTFFRGVFRLPPGHWIRFDRGQTRVASYYDLEPERTLRLRDDREYAEAFGGAFREAVRCRLSAGAATMLSGGLDSSAVTAFAREIRGSSGGPALATLSALTDDPHCEESRHIRDVLRAGRLDPITIRPSQVPDQHDEVERFMATIEDPFDAAMMLPLLLYAAARRAGYEAVLDGVDGDVVASHEPNLLARLLREGAVRAAVREAKGFARFYGATYPPWSSAAGLLARQACRALSPALLKAAVRPARQEWAIRSAIAHSLIRPELAARVGIPDRLRATWSHRAGAISRSPSEMLACEVRHPQIAAALERYHRVAASQGVDARHPFFDKRVVELCLSLPWNQRVRDGWTKYVVRQAATFVLPDEVTWRRGRWVRLGGRFLHAVARACPAVLARELSGSMAEISDLVDVRRIRHLMDRQERGDDEAGEALWSIAALSSWLRKTRSTKYDARARLNGLAALPVAP